MISSDAREIEKEILKSDRGSITRIARRLRIAPQTISQYLSGKTTSARIAKSVATEIRRIQRSHTGEI